MSAKLRIIFMGTPEFSVAPLAALHAAGHEILCVYTQPPRPAGRGQRLQPSPVHQWAAAHGIEVRTPKSVKPEDEKAAFAALDADVAIVAAYGLILPRAILDAPRFGCLNIHASLLPRWRGASPIQRAIWAGDAESGITIMQMDEGLDTGDMLLKESCTLTGETTAQSLHDTLSEIGARLAVTASARLAAQGSRLMGEKQDDTATTYAPLLQKNDGIIDWAQPAAVIDRQIRALTPWPGTVTIRQDASRLKIIAAEPDAHPCAAAAPGTLRDRTGRVACGPHGDQSLRILSVQPEGKKPMDTASAINGGYLVVGESV